MPLIKQPFRDYGENSQEKFQVVSVKLNPKEQIILKETMKILRQTKKSTGLKLALNIAHAKVVQEQNLIKSALESYRKNQRIDLDDIDKKIEKAFEKDLF